MPSEKPSFSDGLADPFSWRKAVNTNLRRSTLAYKLLISSLSNGGKTTLTKDLLDTLVISHDGKRYPFKVPHANVASFVTAAELNQLTVDKMEAYKEKHGKYPSTVVYDTVSKIFDTLMDSCNNRFKGFDIYKELDKEIHEFTEFVEQSLVANGINVIILSHAIWKEEDSQYQLVCKGAFAKRGKHNCLAA